MKVKLELSVNCDTIEDLLQAHYNLSEPVKVIGMEYDETGDLCAFEIEVDAEDSSRINRHWDDFAFTQGLIENAI
jgi:hypothetical protein